MSEYPPYQKSATDKDFLPVVDEFDRVIDARPRREVHLNNLRHRAVHVVVVGSDGRVLLQHRSLHKDSHPGYWDISMGGHVDPGEEYDEAARRELKEELGISGEFHEVGRREASPDSGWEFVRIYECRHDGPFEFPSEEIQDVRWVEPAVLFEEYDPKHEDPDRRVTGSGFLSLKEWARATGRLG